jgi:hypothetical protein
VLAQYQGAVRADLQADCIGCHSAGGIAGTTALVLDALDDERSLDAIESYVLLAGSAALLGKAIGLPTHAGGPGWGSAESEQYRDLATLLDLMATCSPAGGGSGGGNALDQVVLLDNEATLARAALILAGRLPTEAEYTQAATDAGLARALRGLMKGEGFNAFLYETANDWFLTGGVFEPDPLYQQELDSAYPGLDLVSGTEEYRHEILVAWRRQPLELVRFVVETERPFSEVLTADYMLVDDLLAQAYGAEPVPGVAPLANGWFPARVRGASGNQNAEIPFPHAGVLSTFAWLSRFPTSSTNRNRHRVSMLYRQFLGLDIDALGARPDSSPGEFLVPTMQDPDCLTCHAFMDPIAGTFMNWQGDRVIYRLNGDDALDEVYKHGDYPRDEQGERYYQPGDRWFRDVLAPGYGTTPLPGGYRGNDAGLPFLARQVAADSRFARGAVRFWYRGLAGRRALDPPRDHDDPSFELDLAAFALQDDVLKEIAARFQAGGYRVKDLLVELVLSDWFRAARPKDPLDADEERVLAEAGAARLLSAEQLQRRTLSVTGERPFTTFVPYGGFDGGNFQLDRNQLPTTLTASIFDIALLRLVCGERMVERDFDLSAAERRWFGPVERTDVPGDPAAEARIRTCIQRLHRSLLGEDLALDDPELLRTYRLFAEVVANDEPESERTGVAIEGTDFHDGQLFTTDPTDDPAGAIRAWYQVLLYLLTDPRFLDNG